MPALRTLGLVILAAMAVSIGLLGSLYIKSVFDGSAARNAALEVVDACNTVIASGGTQTVEITIPGDYSMSFVDNKVVVDGYRVPEHGFALLFAENSPEISHGTHTLSIAIQGVRLVVTRIL